MKTNEPTSPENQNVPVERPAITPAAGLSPVTLRLAFSVKESAQILGVSEKTVRRLIGRKLLRPSRALRHLLISRKEIDHFLEVTTELDTQPMSNSRPSENAPAKTIRLL